MPGEVQGTSQVIPGEEVGRRVAPGEDGSFSGAESLCERWKLSSKGRSARRRFRAVQGASVWPPVPFPGEECGQPRHRSREWSPAIGCHRLPWIPGEIGDREIPRCDPRSWPRRCEVIRRITAGRLVVACATQVIFYLLEQWPRN